MAESSSEEPMEDEADSSSSSSDEETTDSESDEGDEPSPLGHALGSDGSRLASVGGLRKQPRRRTRERQLKREAKKELKAQKEKEKEKRAAERRRRKRESKRKVKEESAPEPTGAEYVVEAVLNHRELPASVKANGVEKYYEYLVKWKGWAKPTWESVQNLENLKLLDDYVLSWAPEAVYANLNKSRYYCPMCGNTVRPSTLKNHLRLHATRVMPAKMRA